MKKKRAGTLKKQLSGKIAYYSFYPSKLSLYPKIEIDKRT